MSEAGQGWGFDPDAKPLEGAGKCPHCGAVARTEADAEMRFVCGVCGGPRVQLEGEVKLSGKEAPHLAEGQKHRRQRAARRAAGIAAGALGGMLGLGAVIVALLGASLGTMAVTAAVALPFVLLAVWQLSRAGRSTQALKEAVDRAWMSAAQDVVSAAKGPVTAQQLRQALPLPQQEAEALLTRLAVDERLVSRVSSAGELVFEPAVAGMRIAVDAGDDDLEARFKALEAEQEAEAVEEAESLLRRHEEG